LHEEPIPSATEIQAKIERVHESSQIFLKQDEDYMLK